MDVQRMRESVEEVRERGRRAFAEASSREELEAAQVSVLGRKSRLA